MFKSWAHDLHVVLLENKEKKRFIAQQKADLADSLEVVMQ